MVDIILPNWVAQIQNKPLQINQYSIEALHQLKQKLLRFKTSEPTVSIIIPAWNEEANILHTLISLANSTTHFATELIIVDNNSTDGTVELLIQLGITVLMETQQGVGHARTLGLKKAKGKYILTGDSDTLYHPGWVTAMTQAMIDGTTDKVYCVHGSYSFLPSGITARYKYAAYEMISRIIIKRKEKNQPYLNVLGFNTGFIRQNGIAVNGYFLEKQRVFKGTPGMLEQNATEDGMMALRLQQSGGKIIAVDHYPAKVWTSDRRINLDGGLIKALVMRVRKYLLPAAK